MKSTEFVPVGPGGGGAMFAPVISPHDPLLLFVACDMGGVYRSADGGENWTMLDKRQLRSVDPCGVVFHPVDGQVVFACSQGSLKSSSDRGATWTVLCANPSWNDAPCRVLEINTDNVELMFAGAGEAAYRSVDAGRSWSICSGVHGKVTGITSIGLLCLIATSSGVFKSEDGGTTYHQSNQGLPSLNVRGLTVGTTAYVTLPEGIWRSTNGGKTWNPLKRGEQYERIQATSAPEILYATVRRGEHVGIHRSDDAGETWRPVVEGEPGTGAGWIVANSVWDHWTGASWGFSVDRSDPDHAVFTNEGEFYQTTDGGASWVPVYSRIAGDPLPGSRQRTRSIGLEVTSAWQFSFDPHNPARAYICYTDIGFARSLDGGATWTHSARGIPWANTVYQIAFDPEVPGLIYAACSTQHDIVHWTNIEGATGHGGVCVSRDWGATWTPIGTGLPNKPATSIVLDPRSPVDARTLHVTQFGIGVFTSIDGGATWRASEDCPGPTGNRHVYRLKLSDDGTLYCTVTGRREQYDFPVPGGLYQSRDGGKTWTELATSLALRWPGDVETPPGDSHTIYLGAASAPGYSQGGLYKSVDDGKTWQCMIDEHQFPQELCTYAHALFVTIDIRHPNTIYLGSTKHGLFISHDAAVTWKEVPGIPFTSCQRVGFDPLDPDTIWVTTFGGGVWRGRVREF